MGELKSLRIERKLTQNQAADILGVSLRSYKSYENDEKKADSIKYKYMIEKISEIKGIQSFLGSLLFRVFRSGSSVGSFSRVWF